MNAKNAFWSAAAHAKRAINTAHEIIYVVEPFKRAKSKIDYALATIDSLKRIFENIELRASEDILDASKGWKRVFDEDDIMSELCVKILLDYYKPEITRIASTDEFALVSVVCTCTVNDSLKLGWIENVQKHPEKFSIHNCSEKEVLRFIRDTFWSKFESQHAIMKFTDSTEERNYDSFVLSTDSMSDNVIETKESIVISDELKKFSCKNIARAVMLYGQPGTGKSVTAQLIAKRLNKSSFRVVLNKSFSIETIINIAKLLRPTTLIIDDIDKLRNLDEFIFQFELIKSSIPVMIATANDPDDCPVALLRPGRFDETVHISALDEKFVERFVSKDDSAFDRLKSWPIVFIKEYCVRRDALGIKAAHASIKRLEKRLAYQSKIYDDNDWYTSNNEKEEETERTDEDDTEE